LDLHFNPLVLRSDRERIAYVRGYFDAEGGVPHSRRAPFYIQICQKDRVELQKVRAMLEAMGIHCGTIHNPSKTVDPGYWRFYVRCRSHRDFAHRISSWHPGKKRRLRERMKI